MIHAQCRADCINAGVDARWAESPASTLAIRVCGACSSGARSQAAQRCAQSSLLWMPGLRARRRYYSRQSQVLTVAEWVVVVNGVRKAAGSIGDGYCAIPHGVQLGEAAGLKPGSQGGSTARLTDAAQSGKVPPCSLCPSPCPTQACSNNVNALSLRTSRA